MTEPTATPPRVNAATLLARQHEERMAAIMKPGREDRPSFSAKRSTSAGSLGAMAFDVNVPVCEEYPTAEQAFAAMLDYVARANEAWPITNGSKP